MSPEPNLSENERQQLQSGLRPRAMIVHEVIRQEGEEELQRPPQALAFSGLAAGLSMGFSLVVEGLLRAYLPEAGWRPLLESFGYTTGFVIVVLGRQQLFTENTLTAVIPLLTRRTRQCAWAVVRLWAIVLAANLAGAALFALIMSQGLMFEEYHHAAFLAISEEALEGSVASLFAKAVFAGWLIGLMVWLLPGAGSSRLLVILFITYIVALGGFAHVIAGSVEGFYAVLAGATSMTDFGLTFLVPVLLGNIVGGSALVAMLNHAQVREEVAMGKLREDEANPIA